MAPIFVPGSDDLNNVRQPPAQRLPPYPARHGVMLRVAAGPGGASVSVIDQGSGIPPAVQPLLFERFGSATLRLAGLHVDSGLGLPFCKIAAQALGAGLSVESDGRRGTAFTLTFP